MSADMLESKEVPPAHPGSDQALATIAQALTLIEEKYVSPSTGQPKVQTPKRDSVWIKMLRTGLIAFLGVFIPAMTGLADNFVKGQHIDFTIVKSVALAAIVGGIAAVVRAIVAQLPVFWDDNDIGTLSDRSARQ